MHWANLLDHGLHLFVSSSPLHIPMAQLSVNSMPTLRTACVEAVACYQQSTGHAEELTLQPGVTQEVYSKMHSTPVRPWCLVGVVA